MGLEVLWACGIVALKMMLQGVELRSLEKKGDRRGFLGELFRKGWDEESNPCQWNVLESQENVLRGVQVHLRRIDYLLLLRGHISVGLCDLRPDSSTYGKGTLFELTGEEFKLLIIPPGVAHGFYFHEPSLQVQGMSQYWDVDDEVRIIWNDPQLNIPWPAISPLLSEKDAQSPILSSLKGILYKKIPA